MGTQAWRKVVSLVQDEGNLSVVKLQVPGELAYRELATRTVALVCKVATMNVTDGSRSVEFTNELVSAVGEAFNNVAIHGYKDSAPGMVQIVISFDDSSVKVELHDHGTSFDPSAVAPPDLSSLPESGMGLYIMRSFVDQLEYEAGTPNVLALTKYLDTVP